MIEISNDIQKIPKVELHVHLESTFDMQTILYLSQKNNVSLSDIISKKNGELNCRNFNEFLDKSDYVARLIRDETDYEYITYLYLKNCALQNTIYVELMVCPDYAYLASISYKNMVDAISRGITRAKSDFGIISVINILLIRHFPIQNAERILNDVIVYNSKNVKGITIAGDENSTETKFSDFSKIISQFDKMGFKISPHAGEISSSRNIWQCLENFKVSRIGHGVKAIEDNELLNEIIKNKIALEICLSSNIILGVYQNYIEHPFKELYNSGVSLSLNTDDPPFFKTNISQEYQIASKEFNLSIGDLIRVSLMAIESSFADSETKKNLFFKILSYGKLL
jgi:adenosine deaminase